MKEIEYNTRIIAFIDILGFSSRVKRSKSDKNEVKRIYEALDLIRGQFLKKEFNRDFGTEITQFSDSLIISINENQTGGIYHMISDCSYAIHYLISSGFLCRGIILRGELIHKDSICFGPAYLEAISLESSETRPLVKIEKELVEHARLYPGEGNIGDEEGELKFILEFLSELNESEYYIDYFKNYSNIAGDGPQDVIDHYNDIRKLIENGLKDSRSLATYKKYDWARAMFNNSKPIQGYNIRKINHQMAFSQRLKMLPRTLEGYIFSWGKKRYLNQK